MNVLHSDVYRVHIYFCRQNKGKYLNHASTTISPSNGIASCLFKKTVTSSSSLIGTGIGTFRFSLILALLVEDFNPSSPLTGFV